MEVVVCLLSNTQTVKINMLTTYRIALVIVQFIAIIFAVYYWSNYKNTNQRYFLFLIIFSLLCDQVNGSISVYLNERVSLLINILIIVTGYFLLYWFNKVLNKKIIIKVLVTIFSLTTVYSFVTLNFYYHFFSILLTIETIIILFCSVLYFTELINNNKVINYYKSQQFWIVIGLLVFHIGYLPLHLLLGIIKTDTIEFKSAMLLLNIILYGCYSYSFVVSKYKIDE